MKGASVQASGGALADPPAAPAPLIRRPYEQRRTNAADHPLLTHVPTDRKLLLKTLAEPFILKMEEFTDGKPGFSFSRAGLVISSITQLLLTPRTISRLFPTAKLV